MFWKLSKAWSWFCDSGSFFLIVSFSFLGFILFDLMTKTPTPSNFVSFTLAVLYLFLFFEKRRLVRDKKRMDEDLKRGRAAWDLFKASKEINFESEKENK